MKPWGVGTTIVVVLVTEEVTVSVVKSVTKFTTVVTVTMVVVVLNMPVTAALVVITVVVTGTVEVTVDGGPVTVFTGVETDRMRTISGDTVVVAVVALIAVLAEVIANFVAHLTVLKVEELTVRVRSALTFSNRAKKRISLKIIMQRESENSKDLETRCRSRDEKEG